MTGLGITPTRMLLEPARQSISKAQEALVALQSEATTGRHADVGLALGTRAGDASGFRIKLDGIQKKTDDFNLLSAKAEMAQSALSTLSEMTEQFRSTVTASRTSEGGRKIGAQAAGSSLQIFRDVLSATYNGQYLFSGQNIGTAPINDYLSGPRDSVITAFEDSFGFPPSDPAAAEISPDQLLDFITGSMGQIFSGDDWGSTWSNATGLAPTVRLSPMQSTRILTTTDSEFARKIAHALVVVEIFSSSSVNDAAYVKAADFALGQISEGQLLVGEQQALIGGGQNALGNASASLSIQKMFLTKSIKNLEGVDLLEVATSANLMMSTLEASYALTSRLSRLSILSYIR
jgi:flagellar hook-associated protein 3 FlgL